MSGSPTIAARTDAAATATPTTANRDVAVIVVAHNTREPVLRLLDSLRADPEHVSWEVLVVDNESADGTVEAVTARHGWVRVVRNVPQHGYAAAVNQGIALTTAPFVATANPDTMVPRGTIRRLLEVLRSDPWIAAVGPLIRYPDGRVQRQGLHLPRPYTALVVLLGLSNLPFFRTESERYYGRHEPGPPQHVELLPGTFLLFRREALASVGPLDERFFVYCEDVDWSIRATAAGWKLVFAPDVAIQHEKAAASRANSARTIRLYYRSLRLFYAKHHAASAALPVRALWYAGAYLKEAIALAANALRRKKGLRY